MRLRETYGERLRIVWKDFPLYDIHPQAQKAAEAAWCAGDQGKYWEYHDRIFREQYNQGDDLVRFKATDLKKWAKATGMDSATFDACLDSAKYQAEVAKDKADGDAVGIQGTPTFFINGVKVNAFQWHTIEPLLRAKGAK